MAEQCRATANATGQRCRRKAIAGGVTCTVHGSSTKRAKAAAARRVAEAKAKAKATKLLGLAGDTKAVDYREALMHELAVWTLIVGWYRAEISALDRLTAETERGEQAAQLVVLHDRASEHLLRVIKTCHEARIDQQMMDLARVHADQTDRILHAVLRALGHDPQEPTVRQAVRGALTLVEGGAAS